MRQALAILAVITLLTETYQVAPEQLQDAEIQKIRATCYLPTGHKTADGTVPFEGVLAGRREDIGKLAILYSEDGEAIGVFEFHDTGSAKSLKNGTSIDVFREDKESIKEWVSTYGDYVYIQYIEREEEDAEQLTDRAEIER